EVQSRHIVAAGLERWRRFPVPRQDHEFLLMGVDRMLPAARTVLEGPDLALVRRPILFDPEADLIALYVSVFDGPPATLSVDPKRARNEVLRPRRHREPSAGITVVRYRVKNYIDPQEQVALTCGQDLVRRTPPVFLLQAIFQINGRAEGELGEIDDDIRTFRHAHSDAFDLHEMRQQVPVMRNL